ncbi:SLATT domain-containing protein, partial [candidate division GN15 bacterium]|nr:SLATT domain-containing protein [candidate division GN15 bacterium]
ARAYNLVDRTTHANEGKLNVASARLLRDVWLAGQRDYYLKRHHSFERRHHQLEWSGGILLVVAVGLAVAHLAMGLLSDHPLGLKDAWLTMGAIILPAVGAFLAGIKGSRDYKRFSHRYANMAYSLDHHIGLLRLIDPVSETERFMEVVQKARDMMLQEHQGWRHVVRFHELEPPV